MHVTHQQVASAAFFMDPLWCTPWDDTGQYCVHAGESLLGFAVGSLQLIDERMALLVRILAIPLFPQQLVKPGIDLLAALVKIFIKPLDHQLSLFHMVSVIVATAQIQPRCPNLKIPHRSVEIFHDNFHLSGIFYLSVTDCCTCTQPTAASKFWYIKSSYPCKSEFEVFSPRTGMDCCATILAMPTLIDGVPRISQLVTNTVATF